MKKYSFSIVLLSIALSVVGCLLAPYLSIQLNPSYQYPSLTIRTNYQDASPTQVEKVITKPLEAAFRLITSVEKISSISSKGLSDITLEIDKDAELEQVRFEVSTFIRQLFKTFPDYIAFSDIQTNFPGKSEETRPLLSYSLYNDLPRDVIYKYAYESLKPKLSDFKDLSSITVTGGNETEWLISYDSEKISRLNISPQVVSQNLRNQLGNKNLGNFIDGTESIYATIQEDEIYDFYNMVIDTSQQSIIYLKDIATITQTPSKERYYYRVNGRPNVRINFYSKSRSNQLSLTREIKERISTISLQEGYEILKEYDQTEFIQAELDKIKVRTLWSLLLLMIFVILVYRKINHLIIIVIGLAVNLGISSILYYISGVQLNLYALAAITVSFGIIIDNLIVMIDHFGKKQNLKVAPALVSSTLTTVSVLFIILYLPEEWQYNLLDFAKVLGINLIASLFVSIFFIPALMIRLKYNISNDQIRRQKIRFQLELFYKNIILSLRRYRILVRLFFILLFGLPVFFLPNNIDNFKLYNSTIGSSWYQKNLKSHVNKYLGGSLRLFTNYVYEGSTFRKNEETKLYVAASLSMGSTIDQMNDLMIATEKYLDQYTDHIKHYVSSIYGPEYGQIEITFQDQRNVEFPYFLKNSLQAYATAQGGVDWDIFGVGVGYSNKLGGAPPRFLVKIMGYNRQQLQRLATEFSEVLVKHKRVHEVNTEKNLEWWNRNRLEYKLNLDSEKLAFHNFTRSDLSTTLQFFNQEDYYIGRDKNNKAIRLNNVNKESLELWDMDQDYSLMEYPLNLMKVVSLKKEKVEHSIYKENQQYIQLIEWEYTGSKKFGQKHLEDCLVQFKPTLPLGYTLKQTSHIDFGKDQGRSYGLLFMVIGIIFFICSIHFESMKDAVFIIGIIPLSFIGIFLTFYWFDFPFDQGGYISFLLVAGIVVNGLILILTDYKQLRKEFPKLDKLDLYIKAFSTKITPILLTVISTILGLLPFMIFGSQEVFWFSLAVGTMGGLLFSILILLFIPILLKTS